MDGGLRAIARLRPTSTLAEARAEARTIARRLELQYPDMNAKWGMRVEPAQVFYGRHPRPYLVVMLGSVAFVLLIGCANVANLLLARATTRGRELAVRVALGADAAESHAANARRESGDRARSAAPGCRCCRSGACASCATRCRRSWCGSTQGGRALRSSGYALVFTFVVSIATAVVVGLVPALIASRADPQQALKESGRTASGAGGRQRLRSALVVGEVALALMLLFGTGLMVRSFIGLVDTDQGYATEKALTMQLTLPTARYKTDDELIAVLYDLVRSCARAAAAFAQPAVTSSPPPSWDDNSTRFILEGEPKPQRGDPAHQERMRLVSDGYFATLGAPVRAGRDFDRHDDLTSPPVSIVSEAFARRYWPGQDAIGKRISMLATRCA